MPIRRGWYHQIQLVLNAGVISGFAPVGGCTTRIISVGLVIDLHPK